MSSGFRIVEKESDHIVDYEILDKMVCERFGLSNLNPINDDYGYYVFPESLEDGWDGGQEFVSWAGLLHCIAYYSSIRYGRRTKNEIMGALHEMLALAITFPRSTLSFASMLLDFLDQNGMYLFFEYNSSRKTLPLNEKIFIGWHSMIMSSESGLFECDGDGKLLHFYPSIDNILNEQRVREVYSIYKSYYIPCVRTLIIPEGVVSFEHDFFRGWCIRDYICFPKTLKSIGDLSFADTCLPEVTIPDNVQTIGTFAFGNSRLKSLKLTCIHENEYLRHFKDAKIENLYLPYEFRNLLLWGQEFDGYVYWQGATNVIYY